MLQGTWSNLIKTYLNKLTSYDQSLRPKETTVTTYAPRISHATRLHLKIPPARIFGRRLVLSIKRPFFGGGGGGGRLGASLDVPVSSQYLLTNWP